MNSSSYNKLKFYEPGAILTHAQFEAAFKDAIAANDDAFREHLEKNIEIQFDRVRVIHGGDK